MSGMGKSGTVPVLREGSPALRVQLNLNFLRTGFDGRFVTRSLMEVKRGTSAQASWHRVCMGMWQRERICWKTETLLSKTLAHLKKSRWACVLGERVVACLSAPKRALRR